MWRRTRRVRAQLPPLRQSNRARRKWSVPFHREGCRVNRVLKLSSCQQSRTQLEIEVGRLRKQVVASDAELSSLRPLTAEVAQLRSDVQSLTKQTKSLQSSRESAQADLSYMQAQYQAASQAAVERANECRVAEAEAARLRGMLDNAVQQKEAVYKSEIKAVRSMYSRLEKQMAFYKDESRRTQEAAIREKAARWDDYVASNELKAAAAGRERAGLPAEDSGDDEAAAPTTTAGTESLPEPSTLVSSGSSSASRLKDRRACLRTSRLHHSGSTVCRRMSRSLTDRSRRIPRTRAPPVLAATWSSEAPQRQPVVTSSAVNGALVQPTRWPRRVAKRRSRGRSCASTSCANTCMIDFLVNENGCTHSLLVSIWIFTSCVISDFVLSLERLPHFPARDSGASCFGCSGQRATRL